MTNATRYQIGFHGYEDKSVAYAPRYTSVVDTTFTYTFENFFHPFVGELIQQLNLKSLRGMLDPNFHQSLADKEENKNFFENSYTLLTTDLVEIKQPHKEIDVSEHGPYANYNWELCFHIPLTIAVHLSKNQRFAEAQRWFHLIFDPTSNDGSAATPRQRYWKFIRFRQDGDVTQIDQLLALLSKPVTESSDTELALKQAILDGYAAIKNNPFQPHRVARTRHVAYQYNVVMKYLDNLIAWGDSLFRQDTMESLNEATQRYVLAANILGPRPQAIPSRGTVRPKTFKQLSDQGLDPTGNALVQLEGKFSFNLALPQVRATNSDAATPLFGIGRTLYFCIPRNEKLLGYWDTVADRLFKIRHCMNIEGVVRQLALFDPPIDPGLLVKAAAAGINIGSIVNGLNQPVSPVRCVVLIQKALELCSEVRGLGSALLAAVEKGDGEHLALLRQAHEIKIQRLSQDVRFLQWKQAQEATESLLRSRASAIERYHYYQRLLGLTPDTNTVPENLPLDRRTLSEENFDEAYAALVGQYDKAVAIQALPNLKIAQDTSPSNQSGASGSGKLYLNANEDAELNQHLPIARDTRLAASIVEKVASIFSLIPNINVELEFWGLGASSLIFGGDKLSDAVKTVAEILRVVSAWEQDQAGMASKTASYERRADEWINQSNLAARELMQMGRQILSSLIAEQIAHHEYLNIQSQIEQTEEVNRFLGEKFSNEELYVWMQGEISRLYYEYYRFAFDTARKAERTMKQELMRPEVDAQDFVKFNYWDGGRKGLLAGEALYLDVKRMDLAYHENNKRELELTRHVSLRQLDPLALLTLRASGTCQVTIPEWLYDRDCPGHYMRRIKTVALSIPSVVGPYTSVNCTLSLLRSSLRKSSVAGEDYARQGPEDDRFVDYVGAIQSIVTSGGNNDGGLFETNLRDERFLPFEGAGAESTWKLELPNPEAHPAFDYSTIFDVIFHVRYTARQGVERGAVNKALDELFKDAGKSNLALLLSLRHDFPSEWAVFVNGTGDFSATIRKDHFPYFAQNKEITIAGLDLYGQDPTKHSSVNTNGATDALGRDAQFTITAGPDEVLTRPPSAELFLIIRYSL